MVISSDMVLSVARQFESGMGILPMQSPRKRPAHGLEARATSSWSSALSAISSKTMAVVDKILHLPAWFFKGKQRMSSLAVREGREICRRHAWCIDAQKTGTCFSVGGDRRVYALGDDDLK